MNNSAVEKTIKTLISQVGENPLRDGLLETPKRVAKMYRELLSGYSKNPKDVFKVFENNGHGGIVTVINDFYSLCEHHMLPFFGKVYIGYVPNGKILGLSKFTRLIDIFACRLQTQECLTGQIAESISKNLSPQGCIVHIEARHLCMSMRGVKREGITKTTVIDGIFNEKEELINQFYRDTGLSQVNNINFK